MWRSWRAASGVAGTVRRRAPRSRGRWRRCWDASAFLQQNVVFFPLYPLLMRWGGALLGGHPLLAGTVISLAAFAGAISLLYRLAALELGEEKAWPVILLVSTYPYALFYSVVYTESLFLL